MVQVAGTENAELAADKETVAPPGGAGPVRVRVIVAFCPLVTGEATATPARLGLRLQPTGTTAVVQEG
jgi:hypothetical protein